MVAQKLPCWSVNPIKICRGGVFALLMIGLCVGWPGGGHAQTPGSIDARFQAVRGAVYDFAVQKNGKVVYASGTSPIEYANGDIPLKRLNTDGTLDPKFSPPNKAVFLLTQAPKRKVLAIRHKANVVNKLVRLNADGSLDRDFRSPARQYIVTAATVQPDGKILVGSNDYQTRYSTLGVVRLNADGSPDTGFSTHYLSTTTSERVRQLVLQSDGKILVVGGLILGENAGRGMLSRLNADGTLDENFEYAESFPAQAAVIQPDGKILVGVSAGGDRNGKIQSVVRLNSDGSVDPSFNASIEHSGNDAHASIFALALQPDGKVVVGGYFDYVDGAVRRNLARLNADGSLDADFVASEPVDTIYSLNLQADGTLLAAGLSGLMRFYSYVPDTP